VLHCGGAGGGATPPSGADAGPVNGVEGGGAGGDGARGVMPGGPLMRASAVAPAVTFGSSVPQFLQVSPSPSSK
jgi:hypothetical protein